MSARERPAANSSIVTSTPSGLVFRNVVPEEPIQNSPKEQPLSWREWLRHSERSSFLVSLAFHSALLAILAIPITQQLTRSTEEAPLVQVIDPVLEGDPLGELLDAPVLVTSKGSGDKEFEMSGVDTVMPDFPIDSTSALASAGNSGGSDDGNGTADVAGAVGGYLLREPGNAVKAGRFTAFSRPIISIGVGDKKREEFGEPGEPPLEGQAYFIVIHIKVDPKRKTYLLGDLIGSVVGTDGYRQKVPEGMYVLDDEGKPVEVKRSKPVRVTNGIVQLLMRVKGAHSGVRDNIYLKSKMLREEQNLQLIFQSRSEQSED